MTKDERKAELVAIRRRHEQSVKNDCYVMVSESDRAFLLELLDEVGEVLEVCQMRLVEKDAEIAELERELKKTKGYLAATWTMD